MNKDRIRDYLTVIIAKLENIADWTACFGKDTSAYELHINEIKSLQSNLDNLSDNQIMKIANELRSKSTELLR